MEPSNEPQIRIGNWSNSLKKTFVLGNPNYYQRFGFSAEKTASLSLPGPFERERLLGLELRDGALDGACGLIVASGAAAPVHRNKLNRHPEVAAPLRGPRRMAASTARC